MAPPRIDRYDFAEQLGSGGSGVVYAAIDKELDRRVAIKLLHADGNEDDERGQARLLREAKVMAQIAHPNVVTVHDVAPLPGGGGVYMVMELVQGPHVRAWLEAETRGWEEVLAVFVQAARGLKAVHEAGFIHRDFKPSNVILGADGRARVVDFGIVRPAGSEAAGSPAAFTVPSDAKTVTLPLGEDVGDSSVADGDDRVTRAGMVMGTPRYMSPEHLRGQPVDERTDIYSFCIALWEAVYGQAPFSGRSGEQLLEAKLLAEPLPPPSGSRVPDWIRDNLRQGFAPNRDDRFSSFADLLDAMRPPPPKVRTGPRLAMGIAGIAVIGLAVAVGTRLSTPPEPEVVEPKTEFASNPLGPDATIALLPFENLTNDETLGFARDGFPDIIGRELESLEVDTIPYYRLRRHVPLDERMNPEAWIEAARVLGAGAVVSGRVLESAGGFSLEVELQDAKGNRLDQQTHHAAASELPKLVRSSADHIARLAGSSSEANSDANDSLDWDRSMQLAIAAMQEGRHDDAEEHLLAAVAAQPESGLAHFQLAIVQWWADRPVDRVTQAIERALETELSRNQRAFLVAFRPLVERDYVLARARFEALEDQGVEDPWVLYGRFEAQFHGGDPAEAVATYRDLAETWPEFRPANEIDHVLDYGLTHSDDQLLSWALEHMWRNLPSDGLEWDARRLMAQGRLDEAATLLGERRDELRPDLQHIIDAELLCIYVLQGNYALARTVADQLTTHENQVPLFARLAIARLTGDEPNRVRARQSLVATARTMMSGWSPAQVFMALLGMEYLEQPPQELEDIRRGLEEVGDTVHGKDRRVQLARLLLDPQGAFNEDFPELVHVRRALQRAESGDHGGSASEWSAARRYVTDPAQSLLLRALEARELSAAGEHEAVIERCQLVVAPPRFAWNWASLAPNCLRWVEQAQVAQRQEEAASRTRERLAKLAGR